MKRAMLLSLSFVGLSLAFAGTAGAQSTKQAIKHDAKTAGHAIGHGAREVGHATRDVAIKVGHGARDAGRGIGKGAREGWDATKHAFKEVFHKDG
ncbi:MAG TPA: hypothetical protein VFW82_12885 [Dyella sp.]|nr:hypothetical protein [Dyella sp.]